MRFPRFRRLMIGLAVIAVVFCGVKIQERIVEQRRKTFQTLANVHGSYGRGFRDAYEKRTSVVFAKPEGPVFATTLTLRLKWAEYHESLARKYEYAAVQPWVPVAANPPPPEATDD